jgi:hypothetical protein
MLSDKTTEHICRPVDDSPPFTDDDLASLSTILGREPMNVAPQFPSRGWAIFSGFISIIAGIVGVAYPFDSIETLAWWSSLADYPRRHGGRLRVRYRTDIKKVEKVTGTVAAPTP